jgi:hypothetical protein
VKGGDIVPRKSGNKAMSKEMSKTGTHKMPNGMPMKNSDMKKMGKKMPK